MNHPAKSKINYSALIIQVITLLVVFDLVPEGAQEPLIAISGLLLPTLIQTFRTWFTEKKP